LFRQYEITEQKIEMSNLATTVAKKLKDARDPQTVQRMLKIVVHPALRVLSVNTKRNLIELVLELKQKRSSRAQEWKKQAYQNFCQRSVQEIFSLELLQKLQKADRYLTEISSKKMVGGYSGPELHPNSETEQFLQDFDILCCLAGDSFLLGLLREDE